MSIRLTPPKKTVFALSVFLILLGIAGRFYYIPYLSDYCFWLPVAGGGLLTLACIFKGL